MLAAEGALRLVRDLQNIALNAGHPVPLAIALDQENGGVNSLYDDIFIRQFPSAMGIAATGSKTLAKEVAQATAHELSAVGVNWILGPVLDVLTNVRNQPLGVRAFGDDAQEASAYGVEFLKGYQAAGLATCGKHFPSYGNLEFLGAQTDVPIITESVEQLSMSALVPFRNAIVQGIDSMMVGGVAMSSEHMDVMHACLSEQVVQGLLREKLGFDGVVVSECLEMDALSKNIGVGQGTVMAAQAGCDTILICRAFNVQKEAIAGLQLGIENGMIDRHSIRQSLRRILRMKARITSWQQAFNPGDMSLLSALQPSHTELSTKAYNASITVVRDEKRLLPLSNIISPDQDLLLITPLLKPLPASAAAKSTTEISREMSPPANSWHTKASAVNDEQVFKEFGRSLARHRNGRVLHTSYTANGLRPAHEDLIVRASAIIVVTADANRNLYQNGFTKHVSMMCKTQTNASGKFQAKPFIVISVSSPYDFSADPSIGTYICSYDFTETALQALVKVLYGDLQPTGSLPGTINQSQKLHQARQHWLVESWIEERDAHALDILLKSLREEKESDFPHSELSGVSSSAFLLRHPAVEEAHFVVRNSSTKDLYGFCATYYFPATATGVIGIILVDPSRRKLSIGHSLHNRAIRSMLQRKHVKLLQLGSRLPSIYQGIPAGHGLERKRLRQWFANSGWNTGQPSAVCRMIFRGVQSFKPPDGLSKALKSSIYQFDLIHGPEYETPVVEHVDGASKSGIREIYQAALADKNSCSIIRARRREDGAVVGTVVLYKADSIIARHIPAVPGTMANGGGITSPVISSAIPEGRGVLLQGLVLLGIRQMKMQGIGEVILDNVGLIFSIRSSSSRIPFGLPDTSFESWPFLTAISIID